MKAPIIFMVLFSLPLVAQMGSGTTVVSGHVRYKDGSPVENAAVKIYPQAPIGGMLPEPAHTDRLGFYRFNFPSLGESWISASKISEGHPDAIVALYGRNAYASDKLIDLKPGATLTDIDLQFSDPDATADFTVIDGRTHSRIGTAQIYISLASNSDLVSSRTVGLEGHILYVLPKGPVNVSISAPGYAEWRYKDRQSAKDSLLAKPGDHVTVTAELQLTHR